jgi:hypothetical protein
VPDSSREIASKFNTLKRPLGGCHDGCLKSGTSLCRPHDIDSRSLAQSQLESVGGKALARSHASITRRQPHRLGGRLARAWQARGTLEPHAGMQCLCRPTLRRPARGKNFDAFVGDARSIRQVAVVGTPLQIRRPRFRPAAVASAHPRDRDRDDCLSHQHRLSRSTERKAINTKLWTPGRLDVHHPEGGRPPGIRSS